MLDVAFRWLDVNRSPSVFPWTSDFRTFNVAKTKDFDAAVVSIPDHNHIAAALPFLRRGIPVFLEMPLSRTLGELKCLWEVAGDKGRMLFGNISGRYAFSFRVACKVLQSGLLGASPEVYAWTDYPGLSADDPRGWLQPVPRPQGEDSVGRNIFLFDWDSWIGTASPRPFKRFAYHRKNWRAFHDFGTGALGFIGGQMLALPFFGLGIGVPRSVEVIGIPPPVPGSYPAYCKLCLKCDHPSGIVPVHWYEGGRRPPEDVLNTLKESRCDIPASGLLVRGSDGVLFSRGHYGTGSFFRRKGESVFIPVNKHPVCQAANAGTPRIDTTPQFEFIQNIRDGKSNVELEMLLTLTESILLGVLSQRVGHSLEWDHKNWRATDRDANSLIWPTVRKGWEYV